MILDLLNQNNPTKAVDNNNAVMINMYLEEDESKGKHKVIAYPMPGLTSFCDTSQSNIRAMIEHNEVLYVVAGGRFYSVNSAGSATFIAALNTSSGFAKMKVITGGSDTNNQIVIIDGTNGYTYNIGTGTSTFPIADADFPQTATDITNQDDYIICEKTGSIQFVISNLADSTSWDVLDFASKISKADRLVAVNSNHQKLWLLGSKTIEIWFDSGNADFPFQAVPNTFIEYGCAARDSVIAMDNTIYFLAKTPGGGYSVVRMEGFVPQVISSRSVGYDLGRLTTVSDAKASTYYKDGHEFYELTFPTDAKTFTYDLTTQAWYYRNSNVSGSQTRFLGNCYAFCYGKCLVGDYNSGTIYSQHTDVYTENGTAILRTLQSAPVYFEGKRIFVHRLQIDVQTGIGDNKTFTVEKSDDNGVTWTTVETFTVPSSGGRLYTNRVGCARSWVFRIKTSMNANFVVLGFAAEIELGIS